MAKFAGENRYNHLTRAASALHMVPEPLIKAVIGAESAYKPRAFRPEPQINDASRGLMQLLERTARTLGHRGDVERLFDPLLNINLGSKLLAENYQHARAGAPGADPGELWERAVSAYNAGWSPNRPHDAKRKPDGSFVNQAYVDKVLRLTAHYGGVSGLRVPPLELGRTAATAAIVAAVVAGLWFLLS